MTIQRRTVGTLLAPALFLLVWFAPTTDFFGGPSQDTTWAWPPTQQRLMAVFVAIIVLWVTEVVHITVTALLVAPALVVTGITDAKGAFYPFSTPLLFLFVGGFMIAKSMTRHGLDRRLALALLHSAWVKGMTTRSRMAFIVAGLLLSMWISNVATTAILLPILLGTLQRTTPSTAGDTAQGGRVLSASTLSVAYACSIGGLGTPVGSPPNLIAMTFLNEAGIAFGFLDWMSIGLPAALLMCTAVYFVFRDHIPAASAAVDLADEHRTPMSRGERMTAVAFFTAVVGWLVPGVVRALSPETANVIDRFLPASCVAMIAVAVLFFARDDDGRTAILPWRDATTIEWGIIILFGGGISLGTQIFQTGLAHTLGTAFVLATGVSDLWALTAIVILFTVFFTEVCSNTATSNMLAPLVIGVAQGLHINPIAPVMGMALAASCAFMLPIATGPNAMAYGTGTVDSLFMMKRGFWLNLVCAATIFALLRIMCPLRGWT